MADVWLGRFSRWVEKWLNIKGGPALVDLDPQARVVFPYSIGVEDRYLQGWNRFAVVANVAAVSAQFSRARIRNPVGSNVMIVIEQLTIDSSVADTPLVTWGATTTDLTTLVTLTFTRMDPRGNPQPTAIVSFNQQASGGQALLQRGVAAALSTDYITNQDTQIPILPGQVVDVQAFAANTTLLVSFMWRERPMESSELN